MTSSHSAQLSLGHRATTHSICNNTRCSITDNWNTWTRFTLLADHNSNLWTPDLAILTKQTFDCFKVYQHLSKTQKLEGDTSQVAVTEWGYFSEKWKHNFETNKHITPLTSQIINSKSMDETLQFWILIWTERGVNRKRLNTLLLKGRNFVRNWHCLNSYQFCRKILACNVGEVGLSCPLSGCEIYQQL